ncbi:MAG TPA: hypothetical protein DEH65_10275 [Delftia acidovorans]|nr:hypothetical protein EGJ54_07400 [Pandoraea apista]RRX01161.1 hypothetical protein EGJ56_17435 [Pandoraea apista]HBY35354.1 hypothetical protein [Delftia acidovorans]
MMATDSLRIIVLSGVSFCWPLSCRRACSASASALHFALPPAQPSHVQASCLEHGWPAAIAVFAGALAAGAALPPGRSCRDREPGGQGEANAEGKTKGGGTCRPAKPVCTWGWRGTARLRRRAAWGARPAPVQACPRALHDRTRHSLQGAQP